MSDPDADDLRAIMIRALPPGWDEPIRSRDQAAFDRAVRGAWLAAFYRALSSSRNRLEAEEVAQEAFCRVLGHLGSRSSGDRVVRRAYLTQAARNIQRDHWRRQSRRQVADAVFAGDRSGAPGDPGDLVVHREELEHLRAAVATLPPLQVLVLRLRIGEGLTANDTSAVVGKSAAAVRQIQHRALNSLRVRLETRGER